MHGVNDEIIEKFKSVPKDLEIVCVGTTQAHFAFDFSEIDLKGYNLALYCSPIEFDVEVLKRYKNSIREGAIVLIGLEYPIFCIHSIRQMVNDNLQQYAKVLPGKNKYCPKLKQLVRRISPLAKSSQTEVLEYLCRVEAKEKYINHFKRWERERMRDELLLDGWDKVVGITDFTKGAHVNSYDNIKDTLEYNKKKTKELIEYCMEHKYQPVLVALPYSDIVYESLTDYFKKRYFFEPVYEICEEYQCLFLNYAENGELHNKDYYIEVQYLNKKGRKEFMRRLVKDLETVRRG